jgi:hypothetical protein
MCVCKCVARATASHHTTRVYLGLDTSSYFCGTNDDVTYVYDDVTYVYDDVTYVYLGLDTSSYFCGTSG